MVTLTATQKASLGVDVRDSRGNVAQVQGPSWASSDSAILEVTASEDGMSAVARAVGPVGSAMVTFTGDADMGEGVVPIIGTLDFIVTAGQAVAVTITAGAPEEQ